MCGIGGYIGQSKHPEATHQLMTAIFERLESRGTDAAGFWGTEAGVNGKILYHKEPVKSSEFVKKAIWAKVAQAQPNLLLCHARGASTGVGHPSNNRNNHPFVSSDFKVSLIHNGRIPDTEYDALAKKYETFSKCDSEILLRIFEQAEDFDESLKEFDSGLQISHRLQGLSNIWSQIVKGHMAVGIGEQLEDTNRRLWLFRNKFRPIWLMDMRKTLGQIFFCSLPEIWQEAVTHSPLAQPFLRKKTKLIEVPTEEIWVLDVNSNNNIGVRKFDVCTQGYVSSVYEGKPMAMIRKPTTSQVVSRLDTNENVVSNYATTKSFGGTSAKTSETNINTPASQPLFPVGVEVARGIQLSTESFENESLILSGQKKNDKESKSSESVQIDLMEDTPEDSIALASDATFDALAREAYESQEQEQTALDAADENIDEEDDSSEGYALSKLSDKFASMKDNAVPNMSLIIADLVKIQELTKDIENTAQIKIRDSSLGSADYADLMTTLEQVRLDLEGTLQILEN